MHRVGEMETINSMLFRLSGPFVELKKSMLVKWGEL